MSSWKSDGELELHTPSAADIFYTDRLEFLTEVCGGQCVYSRWVQEAAVSALEAALGARNHTGVPATGLKLLTTEPLMINKSIKSNENYLIILFKN